MSATEVVAGAPAVVVPPKPGTPEHAAAMAAMAPANVPAKFKNADGSVDMGKLLEAYKALEVKQSTEAVVAPKADEPAVSLDDAFKAPVVQKADAWKSAQAELTAEGKISDATRTALKASGAPDDVIDNLVAGHQAQKAQVGSRLAAAAGGVEKLNAAIAYARSKMSEPELAALRTALEGPTGTLVVAGLVAQAQAANPIAPARVEPKSVIDGGNGIPGGEPQPFTSNAELYAAFRDPRYQTDPKYRDYCGLRMVAGQRKPR